MVPHQRSLFALGEPAVAADATWEHADLDATAWVDVARGLLTGADSLLDELVGSVQWTRGRSRMYDRVVDDPRLTCRYRSDDVLPHPALAALRDVLAARYGVEFGGTGCNYYRDGRDSVAFHADRELRDRDADAIVAVLSLGARRAFLLRPKHSATRRSSRDFSPGAGDVLVMGGRCQRTWEHGVPKVARCGPRISFTWRACTP